LDPRFAGSNPAKGNGLLRVIKIHSTHSFGGQVKPLAPCRKISWHVKELYKHEEILHRQNSSFPFPYPPALLLNDSASRIARELWWMNQDSTVFLSAYISPGGQTIGPLMATVHRHSLTPSIRSSSSDDILTVPLGLLGKSELFSKS
jgi:hypothetical protein